MAAYEEYLYEKNNKKVKATYIRRKQKKAGTMKTIIDAVNKNEVQEGLELLVDMGSTEFSMEAIVLEFPNEFPNETVKNAKKKLSFDK